MNRNRPVFHFSLATLVVWALTVAGICALNFMPTRVAESTTSYGWPVEALRRERLFKDVYVEHDPITWKRVYTGELSSTWRADWEIWKHGFTNGGLITNVVVAALVSGTVAVLFELASRCREGRT